MSDDVQEHNAKVLRYGCVSLVLAAVLGAVLAYFFSSPQPNPCNGTDEERIAYYIQGGRCD